MNLLSLLILHSPNSEVLPRGEGKRCTRDKQIKPVVPQHSKLHNFVERTMHSADPFSPSLHQEGRCHGTRTQSSIPVSDADVPYNFGQASQGRNPGHMEMNGNTLIDRAGFHLNLLASELLIFHLRHFTSMPFFVPAICAINWVSMSLCTIPGICRSWPQVGPLDAPVRQMTDSNKWEACGLDLNGNRWRTQGQRISSDKITAPNALHC